MSVDTLPGPKSKYDRYVEEIREDIVEIIGEFGCQPILVIGSGLSKRYMDAPNWDGLLSQLADRCSAIENGLAFYKQRLNSAPKIGSEFAAHYQDWAWKSGRNEFPKDMFDASVQAESYIKFKIAEILSSFSIDRSPCLSDENLKRELEALRKIRPHAIITTNYDRMIEEIFPDYHPIIGQNILKGQQVSIGEIYKIHGCVSDYDSIVFTEGDYSSFQKKKKFLSAKLLTFFNEHPLMFVGYSANDPNITAILSDIDEALPTKGGIIPNVYILEWNPSLSAESSPSREKIIATEEGRSIRVKLVDASSFEWVFSALSATPALNYVSPRILRALMARSYELVRHDIPRMTVHADFKMLSESVDSSENFAKLFGIASIEASSAASASHPFSATQLGTALGGKTWHTANALIDRVKAEKGIDLKSYDNRYHRTEFVNTTPYHKYSRDMLRLLEKVKNGEEYVVDV